MKKIGFCFLISFLFASYINAQDQEINGMKKDAERTFKKDPKDTTKKIWKTGGVFSLNLNQGSLSNWASGGDKFSFSINSFASLYAYYKKDRHSWDNSLDLAYGFVNTTSLGSRKAADRIDLLSKYTFKLHKKWNAGILFNGRTQFDRGKAYEKTPAGTDTSYTISRFFAPAYLLGSLGIDYKPVKNLSVFLSPITARYVVVTDKHLGPAFGLDSGKIVKNEIGAYLTTNFNTSISKSFNFKTRLDLFSNYKKKPQNIDVYWSNVVTAKITKYINFSFNLDMIYDDDTKNINPSKGPAPQWLQLMGIGFSYSFANRKI
ncbi:MAG: DUF3078 domain-containing protein [Chitinophagaceae bacterium]|nr:DUF3078 domain-containing protein [Chitinophagaceae bacterium]MCW5916548.1 DUF3078 domain-containing protein [Ferruginibacter sp.]